MFSHLKKAYGKAVKAEAVKTTFISITRPKFVELYRNIRPTVFKTMNIKSGWIRSGLNPLCRNKFSLPNTPFSELISEEPSH